MESVTRSHAEGSNEFPSHSRPPWRLIASRIDSEFPRTAVIASEPFVIEPLEYYSHRAIHSAVIQDDVSRLLFYCRPSNCHDLDGLRRRFKLLNETTFEWTRYPASPTSMLKEYVFEIVP